MNKKVIDRQLPLAYRALKEVGIAKNGEIQKSFRAQISTFGAAVTTGSLTAAIAFFSEQGAALTARPLLLKALWNVITTDELLKTEVKEKDLFEFANQNRNAKEIILNAAIAVKLAMNLYHLTKDE